VLALFHVHVNVLVKLLTHVVGVAVRLVQLGAVGGVTVTV